VPEHAQLSQPVVASHVRATRWLRSLLLTPLVGPPRPAHMSVSPVRRTMAISQWEGMLADIYASLTSGTILMAWGLHLGAGEVVLALLGVVPFIAQLAQLGAGALTAHFGGRATTLWGIGLARQLFWLLVPLPFLGLSHAVQLTVVVCVALAAAVLQVVGATAWSHWMGDVVPPRLRGRYFGRRSAAVLVAGAIGSLAASLLLDLSRRHHVEREALCALSLAAVTLGAVTTLMLRRQHDPAVTRRPVALREGVSAALGDPHVRRMLLFLLLWSGAIGVAVPFWGPFMKRDLQLSFTLLAAHQLGSSIVRLMAAPLWGRAVDRLGARPVLVFCSFATAAIPLIWLLPTPDRLWPVAVDAVIAGFFWSGHGIATFQLPLALSDRHLRPYVLGLAGMATGGMVAVAGLLGGLLAESLPARPLLFGREWYPLQLLFILTSAARFGSALIALRVTEPGSAPVAGLLGLLRRPGAAQATLSR